MTDKLQKCRDADRCRDCRQGAWSTMPGCYEQEVEPPDDTLAPHIPVILTLHDSVTPPPGSAGYWVRLEDYRAQVAEVERLHICLDASVHALSGQRDELRREVKRLRNKLRQHGPFFALWRIADMVFTDEIWEEEKHGFDIIVERVRNLHERADSWRRWAILAQKQRDAARNERDELRAKLTTVKRLFCLDDDTDAEDLIEVAE